MGNYYLELVQFFRNLTVGDVLFLRLDHQTLNKEGECALIHRWVIGDGDDLVAIGIQMQLISALLEAHAELKLEMLGAYDANGSLIPSLGSYIEEMGAWSRMNFQTPREVRYRVVSAT